MKTLAYKNDYIYIVVPAFTAFIGLTRSPA